VSPISTEVLAITIVWMRVIVAATPINLAHSEILDDMRVGIKVNAKFLVVVLMFVPFFIWVLLLAMRHHPIIKASALLN
jgi:hypothetical protein